VTPSTPTGSAATGSAATTAPPPAPVTAVPTTAVPTTAVSATAVSATEVPAAAVPADPDGGVPAPGWDEIAEQYGDMVLTMAYRLTGDRDEARDLAQDVFVRVYRNLDRYRPGTFEGWLYRITKNLFLDRVRRHTRVRLEPLPDEEWRQPSESDPGPAETVEAGVLRSDLETALEDLAPSFRTAVILCDVQGLSYEEISDALGWPIGTVRSRIHRGRKALRNALEAEARRG